MKALRQGLEDLDRRQGYRGHVREVPKDGLEEAILALVAENGFESPTTGEPGEDENKGESVEELDLFTRVTEKLAEPAPLLGVVTSVDRKAKLAHVALGPGVSAVTHLEDVSWARPADPGVAAIRSSRSARSSRSEM